MMLVMKIKMAAITFGAVLAVSALTAFAVKAATAVYAIVPATAGSTDLAVPGVENVISQIHNAPQWKAGAAYKPGNRVVNLTEKPAGAYECVTGGIAGNPAPSGQGGSVKDGGGVIWRYLSEVDYTSLTAWLYDAPRWKEGTTYGYHDHVIFGDPLCTYECGVVGPGASTLDPTQTDPQYRDYPDNPYREIDPRNFKSKNVKVSADGYMWWKVATIGYTSGKSWIPTWQYPPNSTDIRKAEVQMKKSYTAVLWNDAEYVAGERGENHPIHLDNHQGWHSGDAAPQGVDAKHRLIITAAPGESFMDRTDAPLCYDPSQGVAIRNPSGGLGPWGWSGGNGLLFSDGYVTIDRVQIKSETARVSGDIDGNAPNGVIMTNDLLESDATGKVQAMECDCVGVMDNCLLIGSAAQGIYPKYPMRISHCTVVTQKSEPDSIGVMSGIPWDLDFVKHGEVLNHCLIFGWAHSVAAEPYWGHWNKTVKDWAFDEGRGGDNATDLADPGEEFFPDKKLKTCSLPGANNHYKVPYDKTTFRDPGNDWRLVANSPLQGIGFSRAHPADVKIDGKGVVTSFGVK